MNLLAEPTIDGIIVFLIGSIVGVGELVARYRDEPRRAIQTRSAMLYVAINGFASLFALVALLTFGWTPGGTATPEAQRLLRILGAGFGAMAIFRTSLFVVRVGNTDVGVGPVAFLQILLGATDRGVDRKRASDRAEQVVRIMGDLDFDTIYKSLPAFSIMLMQNLTFEDQKAIGDQIKQLVSDSDIPPQAKVLNLGLLLMNFVGEEVLEDAVRGIRGQVPDASSRLSSLGKAVGLHRRDGARSDSRAGSGVAGAPVSNGPDHPAVSGSAGAGTENLPSVAPTAKPEEEVPAPPPGQTATGTALPPTTPPANP